MVFSDSHCHLVSYPPELRGKVLAQARTKGISIIVSLGETLEASAETISLAQSHQGVLAGVGIHPWNAVPLTDEIRRHFNRLVARERVVVIGEIGLDYARNPQTKEIQKELFKYQLAIARERSLPVNIHCREAHRDMRDILSKEIGSGLQGIIHGFTGDVTVLKDWLALDLYISIGRRVLVADDNPALQAAVVEIPQERLLTETDATGSGQSAGPADVILVVEKLASLRRTTSEKIASTATTNLRRLLNLPREP